MTRFFQFLLYILLVIIAYFLVRKISSKVHEAFEHQDMANDLPPRIDITAKLEDNNATLYFMIPHNKRNKATDIMISNEVSGKTTKEVYYVIDDLEKENDVYKVNIYDLPYDINTMLSMKLKNKWGFGHVSNKLTLKPVESNLLPGKKENPKSNDLPYVSCHPDGTYTIHKNYIYTPNIESNYSVGLHKLLSNIMKPKTTTYDVKLNLE
jgi:hypothetical protein